jgi:hypothetical protein
MIDLYCTGFMCNDREHCMRFAKENDIPHGYEFIKGKNTPYDDCKEIMKDE